MNWLSVRNPITYDEVIAIEEFFNITLPSDYKNAVGEINGGALKSAYVLHPTLGKIAYSRNVALDKKTKANIFELFEIFQNKNLFPFGQVGNGDYFCFDLKDHSVVIYFHETDNIEYVCDSFTKLMEMICVSE